MSPLVAILIPAGLVGLALVGFVFARRWPAKCPARLGCASSALLVLGLFGFLSLFGVTIYDGGAYLQAEFRITFEDANHRPIEGVELRVEDLRGRTFHRYPVSDFLPAHIPESDSDGLMVFHHAGDGVEFGGKCWLLFGLFLVEEHRGPVYVCRFLHQGQEVYRVGYGEINSWRQGSWDEVERIERKWKRPDWPMSQLLLMEWESLEAYHVRSRKFFDLDGDGKLNPEEAAAYRAGTHWRNEEAAIARLKGEDPEEEIEFAVVRRTVTIQPNPE